MSNHLGKPFEPKAGTFGAFMQKQGIHSWVPLQKRLPGLATGIWTAKRLHTKPTQVAPNSPVLPVLAKALKTDLATVQGFAKGKPLEGRWLEMAQSKVTNSLNGRRQGSKKAKAKAGGRGVTLGVVHVRAGRKITLTKGTTKGATKGKRHNRLRGAPLALRELIRTFVNTINIAVTNGTALFPPVSVAEMHMLLTDYLIVEKGLPATTLLDPNLAALFDV